MALTLRQTKGSALTHVEMDENFSGLASGVNWSVTVAAQSTALTVRTLTTGGTVTILADDETAESQISRASGNTGGPFRYFNKSRGTTSARTAVSSGDILGQIIFRGYNGSSFSPAASVRAIVNGTVTGGGAADMPGKIVWATSSDGSDTVTDRVELNASGELLNINAAGSGYGTGAGGQVTQDTSKSTTVTINKPCGKITMNNATLTAGTTVGFSVNNTVYASGDCVHVMLFASGSASSYNLWAARNATGVFNVYLRNITAGDLSDAVEISFVITKGATA